MTAPVPAAGERPAAVPAARRSGAPAGRGRAWTPGFELDIRRTLSVLQRGAGDPTQRLSSAEAWRTMRTPDGPASLRLVGRGGSIDATAWGPGAAWALAAVPDLLGARDRPEEFPRVAGPLLDAARRQRGMRIPRTGLVYEMLVPSVLEQLVTGAEARRSWRELLWRYGDPAPGPTPPGMRVIPPPETLVRLPAWEWHRAGVDGRRRQTLIAVARVAGSLDRLADLPVDAAKRRLLTLPGVGPWTVAEVAARAFGDVDAVPVGDFHLPTVVGRALAGRPLDDAGMLAALAPYAPQRYRAIRLVEVAGGGRPRFGPRHPIRDNRRM